MSALGVVGPIAGLQLLDPWAKVVAVLVILGMMAWMLWPRHR